MNSDLKEENKELLEISWKKLPTEHHSVYLTSDTWDRLNKLFALYDGVRKQNVLDALLQKALDDFGV